MINGYEYWISYLIFETMDIHWTPVYDIEKGLQMIERYKLKYPN